MKKALQNASKIIHSQDENHIRKHIHHEESEISFYANSVHKKDSTVVSMARDKFSRFIMLISGRQDGIFARFEGEQVGDAGIYAKKCPLSDANACVLRELFPWTAPVPVLGRKATIGCGDRLGLAAPGHVAAFKKFDATPVLAQQSIRELKLTNRSYRDVMDDTTFLVFQSGYKDGFGADGDHLKSESHINMAMAAGVTMITLDLSDELTPQAAAWPESEVCQAFNGLSETVRTRVMETYSDKSFGVGSSEIRISSLEAMRCAVIYSKALDFAAAASRLIDSASHGKVDLEISIDETTAPTLPEHHLFVASELLHRKVRFASLAPRFIGEFQKAIDYIGDIKEFERQLAVHVEIAKHFGSYKLSVHSGSDKFKVFPSIGRLTGGHLHLKTAGTSWLEAVRTIAETDATLFREMYGKAISGLVAATKLYHVGSDFTKIPLLLSLSDKELPKLLEMDESRQMLHITYGAMLEDLPLKKKIYAALHMEEELYHEKLMDHFVRHLSLLKLPKKA